MFSINAETGSVVWVDPPKYHPRMRGKEAGTLKPNHSGKLYCVIRIGRQPVKRGHLIFFSVFGRWPKPCLDHVNGDSTDDRIGNLREATVTQNAWNHKRRAKRSKLPMGVRSVKSGRYQARLAVNKKMLHLGTFATPEEAHAVYRQKRSEMYGQFA